MAPEASADPESLTEEPRTVLVVTPHPDDAEGGAGGTIARWANEGRTVVLVVCTNGDKGTSDRAVDPEDLARTREREQLEAARELGISHVEFLRLPDQGLEDTAQFREKLVRQIRVHRPHTVVTVDPNRPYIRHRDHHMTGRVTLDAVFPYARDHLSLPRAPPGGPRASQGPRSVPMGLPRAGLVCRHDGYLRNPDESASSPREPGGRAHQGATGACGMALPRGPAKSSELGSPSGSNASSYPDRPSGTAPAQLSQPPHSKQEERPIGAGQRRCGRPRHRRGGFGSRLLLESGRGRLRCHMPRSGRMARPHTVPHYSRRLGRSTGRPTSTPIPTSDDCHKTTQSTTMPLRSSR